MESLTVDIDKQQFNSPLASPVSYTLEELREEVRLALEEVERGELVNHEEVIKLLHSYL